MKKRLFASLTALAPLLLLTACGGGPVPLSFSSNWYKNTTLQSIEGTHEELEYEVTFDGEPQDGYSVLYTEGVYKTTLVNAPLTLGGEQQGGFVLTTELSISVQFEYLGKQSEVFHDSVVTEAEFLPVWERLRPVRSKRTVTSHVPAEYPSSDLLYHEYSYTYEMSYPSAGDVPEKGIMTYTDLRSEAEPVVKEFEIGDGATYLDNEELLFALRGLSMESAVEFRTFNTATETVARIGFNDYPAKTTQPVKFEMNGTAVDETALPVYSVDLAFKGNRPGQTQTLVYAALADNPNANTYRNVLLSADTPILYSLGTMKYRLTKATFTDK